MEWYGQTYQLREADGTIDNLAKSLAKFSQRIKVVEHARRENLHASSAKSWGPAMVFSVCWSVPSKAYW